ncbi:hypothetical protein DIZ27_36240 [Streptomyces sp. NWU339]|nr:hypothetical protein DIZ27_36240 [Streptomyces sp. NWU339]
MGQQPAPSGSLVPGRGSFPKECEHPRPRWSKRPHPYKIQYRSAAGKQVEESGFATPEAGVPDV